MKFEQDTIDAIAKHADRAGIKAEAVAPMIADMEKLLDFLRPELAEPDVASAKEWDSRTAWRELLKAHAKATDTRIRKARKMQAKDSKEVEVLLMLARHKREADDMREALKPKPGRKPRWVGRDVFCKRMIRAWEGAGGEVVLSDASDFIKCVKLVLREWRRLGFDVVESPRSLFRDNKSRPRYPVE